MKRYVKVRYFDEEFEIQERAFMAEEVGWQAWEGVVTIWEGSKYLCYATRAFAIPVERLLALDMHKQNEGGKNEQGYG